MNPTLDDLRAALDDAAATSHASGERLDGVRRVVARRKARRAVVAGAASFALLVGGIAVGADLLDRRDVAVQPVAPTQELLPEYHGGGRLLGADTVTAEIGSVATVTVTPTSYGLAGLGVCPDTPGAALTVRTAVNGRTVGEGGCGGGFRGAGYRDGDAVDRAFWSNLGVELGRPFTLTMTVVPASEFPVGGGPELPDVDSADVRLSVGIYQDVPVEEYPFPARPATLEPLGQTFVAVSEPVAVLRPGTTGATVAWDENLQVGLVAVEPGTVRLLVDGVVVAGSSFWEYEFHGAQVSLSSRTLTDAGLPAPEPGQVLTLTVETEGFERGAWQVSVGPPA